MGRIAWLPVGSLGSFPGYRLLAGSEYGLPAEMVLDPDQSEVRARLSRRTPDEKPGRRTKAQDSQKSRLPAGSTIAL